MALESKYPTVVVTGKNITPEQATEVLIRTFDPQCIDTHVFGGDAREVYRALGATVRDLTPDEAHWLKNESKGVYLTNLSQDIVEVYQQYNPLDIQYLVTRSLYNMFDNYGGWLGWDGKVGVSYAPVPCRYPTHEDIEYELNLLGEAFPYLDLRFMFVTTNYEICDAKPGDECMGGLVEALYSLKNGEVKNISEEAPKRYEVLGWDGRKEHHPPLASLGTRCRMIREYVKKFRKKLTIEAGIR